MLGYLRQERDYLVRGVAGAPLLPEAAAPRRQEVEDVDAARVITCNAVRVERGAVDDGGRATSKHADLLRVVHKPAVRDAERHAVMQNDFASVGAGENRFRLSWGT